jgi:hypothetical protein
LDYLIADLIVGQTYRVRVSAVNAVGEGFPADWSDPFTVIIAGRPSAPQNATIANGRVTWDPPLSDGDAPIVDYRVQLFTTWKATSEYLVAADGIRARELAPSVFAVLISARNRVGESLFTLATPATLGVTAVPSGDGSIRVAWGSPESVALVPGVTGFQLIARFVLGGEENRIIDCSAGAVSADISGLTVLNYWQYLADAGDAVVDADASGNCPYVFTVTATLDPTIYEIEEGRTFGGIVTRAPVTVPGAIEVLDVVEDGLNLQITWESPKYGFGEGGFVSDGGSPLVAYHVDLSGAYLVTRMSVVPSGPLSLTFTLTDPGANIVRVSAANAYLTGLAAEVGPFLFTTLPDPPFDLQARAMSGTSAVVTWRAPWNSGGLPIESYDVEYFSIAESGETEEPVRVSTETAVLSKVFAGWDATSVYKIRARTVTEKGVSSWTDYITFRISDDVPVVPSVVASREGDNIRVEWDDVAGAVGYMIEANFNGEEVAGVPVYVPVTEGILSVSTFTYPGGMLPLLDGIYRFRVMAIGVAGAGPWIYSNQVSMVAGEGVVCFLGDAPVRTPTGWARIDSLVAGDLVRTADGRNVVIRRVAHQRVRATRQTCPYRIARGQFGARRDLLISPEHRVRIREEMIEARRLGLPQVGWGRDRVIDYYNLELPDWERDNLVVAGVEVESLAPLRRVRVSYAEFAALLQEEYGTAITAELVAQLRERCVFYLDGTVEVPVVRPAAGRR